MNIEKDNPKEFWDTLKKLLNWGKENHDPTDKITPEKWIEYYKNLLNNPSSQFPAPDIGHVGSFEPILDARITIIAILESKATGPDEVLVEYLKIFAETQ